MVLGARIALRTALRCADRMIGVRGPEIGVGGGEFVVEAAEGTVEMLLFDLHLLIVRVDANGQRPSRAGHGSALDEWIGTGRIRHPRNLKRPRPIRARARSCRPPRDVAGRVRLGRLSASEIACAPANREEMS